MKGILILNMFTITNDNNIILASGSPRRKDLMVNAGICPIVSPSDIDEKIPAGLDYKNAVMYLALRKALAKEQELPAVCRKGDLIIGADTVVVFNDQILGKPLDYDDAFDTLKALKNNTHHVATGVAVIQCGTHQREIFVSVTEVVFKDYSDDDIKEYLSTDEPWDKAGSYAVQGLWNKHVEKFVGDYNNIVGLPVEELMKRITIKS